MKYGSRHRRFRIALIIVAILAFQPTYGQSVRIEAFSAAEQRPQPMLESTAILPIEALPEARPMPVPVFHLPRGVPTGSIAPRGVDLSTGRLMMAPPAPDGPPLQFRRSGSPGAFHSDVELRRHGDFRLREESGSGTGDGTEFERALGDGTDPERGSGDETEDVDSRSPALFGSKTQVTDSAVQPWSLNVKLWTRFSDGWYVCSGSLFDDAHVLTAAHCLNKGGNNGSPGEWTRRVIVVPGYDEGFEPFGRAEAAEVWAWPDWVNYSDFNGDMGWVVLNRSVGALTGFFGFDWNGDDAFFTGSTFRNPGYPAEPPFNGQHLYVWEGSFDRALSNILEHDTDPPLAGGQSGSGAYHTAAGGVGSQYAVASYTFRRSGTRVPPSGYNRMTKARFDWTLELSDHHRPAEFDLEALSVIATPEDPLAGAELAGATVYVYNGSNQSSAGSWCFDAYLASTEVVSTAATFVGRSCFEWSFEPRGGVWVDFPVTVPDGMAGVRYLGVILDVSDANPANNTTRGWDAQKLDVRSPATASPAFVEVNGLVVLEAEHFHAHVGRSGKQWTEVPLEGSVGSSMRAEPVTTLNVTANYVETSPELQYRVRFSTAGTYFVWARAFATDGDADSWHVGLNGAASSAGAHINMGPPFNRWRWHTNTIGGGPPARLEVTSPGEHVLNVWMREDGVAVDRLLLTTDPDFVPGGTGPPESERADEEVHPALAFVEMDGLVVMESEHFDAHVSRSGKSWVEHDLSGNSGTSMRSEPATGANVDVDYATTSPELQYRVRFSTTGTYYVWARAHAADGDEDSWHVGLNGEPLASAARINMGPPFNRWRWHASLIGRGPPASVEITEPGVHVVHVWMREDGVYLDRLLLTTDAEWVPSGIGPAESPRTDAALARVFAADSGPHGTATGADPVRGGSTSGSNGAPERTELLGAYPNPFNPETTIQYAVSEEVHVRLEIYDVTGRRIATLVDETQRPGFHEIRFNGSGLATGVYLYRFRAGPVMHSGRMLLVK